jgi:hypothetical protein
MKLSLESTIEYAPLDVMAIIDVIANHPSCGLPQNLK